jgi:hypothetical protein
VQQAINAAVLEVAEKLDAGPIRVRAALAGFIGRLVQADVDARMARGLLAGR